MNVSRTLASLLALSAIATTAAAEDVYFDQARVIAVTPQTERINHPREECHSEYMRDPYARSGQRDIGGAIIGGIAGGLLGSQIGKGNGRVAGAAVGAAAGAMVGDRIDNSERYASSGRSVERCELIDDWQTVTRDYLVTYRYHGRDYTTTLPYDPGRTLRVRVAIAPESDGDYSRTSAIPGHAYYRGGSEHGRY